MEVGGGVCCDPVWGVEEGGGDKVAGHCVRCSRWVINLHLSGENQSAIGDGFTRKLMQGVSREYPPIMSSFKIKRT